MNFTLPRGLRDIEPEECNLLENIRDAFTNTRKLFGFKLMEPSSLEFLETLEAKSGEAIKKEIYFFKDKSKREIALRFDLTVGISRWVASRRDLQYPIKLGSFGSMWRYDEPQYGRYRWFYQWDVEIFGPSKADSDAEIIDFTYTLFKRLGIEPIAIKLGDRKIVEKIIRKRTGSNNQSEIFDMLRALDKLKKKKEEDIINEYQAKGITQTNIKQILEIGKLSGDPNKILNKLEPDLDDVSRRMIETIDILNSRGVQGVQLDLSIVRGIDYYTGPVFEVFDVNTKDLGALAGGGSYDSLPEIFGRKEIGATGVAGGVERTIISLKKNRKTDFNRSGKIKVYVAFVGKESAHLASRITAQLRRSNILAEVELMGRSLKKQLEVAASLNARYTIIVAPREMASGKVVLRDMNTGNEENQTSEEVISTLITKDQTG